MCGCQYRRRYKRIQHGYEDSAWPGKIERKKDREILLQYHHRSTIIAQRLMDGKTTTTTAATWVVWEA